MKQISAHISTILSIVILVASLLPALHAFDHEASSKSDTALTQDFTKASIDCDLCDFQIANTDAPSIFTYKVYPPQKESVYAISLAETVNLFPNPLFSLRAPPAVLV
ncbi:hypothetical protein [Gillisia limnaea]|uniref:Uncharacterized protein n=1 Tax=Gillisia limnaea (strain DSM 15749 / LMG 21470 / R-8282) TaxID=865937 RepID=H2BTQ5_GILLR|nr:hypothetical protein [Gillisia limnaea]EHQ02675.1 hypothetical protein Gilli_2037 [Gillisia limnaea DSM 15749]